MTLAIRASFPNNVFELMGKDESSATYALGWTLERSPFLASLAAQKLAGKVVNAAKMRVALLTCPHPPYQSFGDSPGL